MIALLENGYAVTVIDDLSSSDGSLIPEGARFVFGCVGDAALVATILRQTRACAIMHFAASISVAQSLKSPAPYYRNNLSVTIDLARVAADAGVRAMVFSSTAAVYGEGDGSPLAEDRVLAPINTYGRSKAMAESALADIASAGGMALGILRYFNAAGADPAGRAGQATADPHHLIEVATHVATGTRDAIAIFGNDYPTPDGTAVRDYVHVADIAAAHVLVMRDILQAPAQRTYNVGTGRGASVREVIDAVARVAGAPIPVRMAPRRHGDPAILIADSSRLATELGWRPRYGLDDIVRHALMWERSRAAYSATASDARARLVGIAS
ncbi:UDP-glucose 4-epimerase GalE [Polymorphobacter multimanifer]|uniref:UDP-glucose 4-epimerase n=1 Tax=Polymorphobacter multimanifer TaxID=1070431 RepID=A0A841L621_9SPHN|nr:UDP-glucose 4-epimerase [Polymorphobacter multimanifer]GGI67840.1 UDP-glucose 4-epimerase GalE [Polymorphobacter multimanifer]